MYLSSTLGSHVEGPRRQGLTGGALGDQGSSDQFSLVQLNVSEHGPRGSRSEAATSPNRAALRHRRRPPSQALTAASERQALIERWAQRHGIDATRRLAEAEDLADAVAAEITPDNSVDPYAKS